MRIYVASSWRNERQPEVVKVLRNAGHDVYDFKNPRPGDHGFHWSEIDPQWKEWTAPKFYAALSHPLAVKGFRSDYRALMWAEACVLVLPCGRSAHLEAGWCIGKGKPTVALVLGHNEPELMYALADEICWDIGDLPAMLEGAQEWRAKMGGRPCA